MALQADFAARKGWLGRPGCVQAVKNDSLFGIERRDFIHLAMRHKSHRHLVIEIEGARSLRGYQSRLKAVR